MRYVVVLNEKAGQAGKNPPGGSPGELREAFTRAGIDVEVHVAKPAGIEDAVRAALSSRPDAVIVGGGDGTVRSAAAVLAGTDVPLGVLPMGTLNHFAKDLEISVNLEEAVPSLARGHTRNVDLGEVNGHVFINNCSLGAYAQAVRRRDALRNQRGLGKWWAMARASFEVFRRLRRLRLRIRVGMERADPSLLSASDPELATQRVGATHSTVGHARVVRTPVVVVGNNRYSGRLLSQHLRPRLDAGQLWLYAVRTQRRLGVLRMMLQSFFVRRLDEVDTLDAEPAQEIVIESDSGPVPVAADGEVLALTAPLHFRIRRGALRVLVPTREGRTEDGQLRAEDGRRRTGNRQPETVLTLQPPTPDSIPGHA